MSLQHSHNDCMVWVESISNGVFMLMPTVRCLYQTALSVTPLCHPWPNMNLVICWCQLRLQFAANIRSITISAAVHRVFMLVHMHRHQYHCITLYVRSFQINKWLIHTFFFLSLKQYTMNYRFPFSECTRWCMRISNNNAKCAVFKLRLELSKNGVAVLVFLWNVFWAKFLKYLEIHLNIEAFRSVYLKAQIIYGRQFKWSTLQI